eukprot:1153081-Pelagomonas_calceolata.AAC.9
MHLYLCDVCSDKPDEPDMDDEAEAELLAQIQELHGELAASKRQVSRNLILLSPALVRCIIMFKHNAWQACCLQTPARNTHTHACRVGTAFSTVPLELQQLHRHSNLGKVSCGLPRSTCHPMQHSGTENDKMAIHYGQRAFGAWSLRSAQKHLPSCIPCRQRQPFSKGSARLMHGACKVEVTKIKNNVHVRHPKHECSGQTTGTHTPNRGGYGRGGYSLDGTGADYEKDLEIQGWTATTLEMCNAVRLVQKFNVQ